LVDKWTIVVISNVGIFCLLGINITHGPRQTNQRQSQVDNVENNHVQVHMIVMYLID